MLCSSNIIRIIVYLDMRYFSDLDQRSPSCSSCSACCCLHSLNAYLASCSWIRDYLPPVAFSSLGSFNNIRANAPIRKELTSIRELFSKKTKTKQSPMIIRPSNVVLGSFQMRSIIIARFYHEANPCATSTRCRRVMLQAPTSPSPDERSSPTNQLPSKTKR